MKQNLEGRVCRPGTPSPGAQLRSGRWGGWVWQVEAASNKLVVGCPSRSPRVLQIERGPVFSAEEPKGWYTASDGQESRARLSAMLSTAQINRTWAHPSRALQSGDVWNHSRIPRPPLSTCPGPGTHVCLLYGRACFILTSEVSTVTNLGLPMGRQVHREGPVPGHTSGKLPGKINRGPHSSSQDQGAQTGKTHGHPLREWEVADCRAFHRLPKPRPPWLTRSDCSALE